MKRQGKADIVPLRSMGLNRLQAEIRCAFRVIGINVAFGPKPTFTVDPVAALPHPESCRLVETDLIWPSHNRYVDEATQDRGP